MSIPLVPNHLAGRRVGQRRFELVSLLGEGSYGAVYRALHHRGGAKEPRLCAIKVLRTTHRESSLFHQQRELELHRRVSDCDGIVTLYETFKEGHYQYMVMKLCPDRDLSYWISKKQYLGNDSKIKDVFMQVLDAIDYCHSHSVFHRDIKPQNVLLCEGGRKVLLSDFGLATGNCISTETRTGSPWYMSPECWGTFPWDRSYATAPNDIWALGILLINIVCRKAPWRIANLEDKFFCEFVKRPHMLRFLVPLSPDVHDILLRVFTINPEKRIDIKDFKAAIQNVKSFSIPAARQTEYYECHRAAWRAIALPTPSYPLVLAPAHHNLGHVITKPPAVARVDRPYPPSSDNNQITPLAPTYSMKQIHRKAKIYLPPTVYLNTCTLSPMLSLAYISPIAREAPVKPQMQAVPESEAREIHFINPLRNHTLGVARPATESVSFLAHSSSPDKPAPSRSWQSILDAMNAW